MAQYNIITESMDSTVVTEYKPVKAKSESYQSEAELEKEFISLLQEQSYEYLPIHKEGDLIFNLRQQIERLNDYVFTDDEWKRFFGDYISSMLNFNHPARNEKNHLTAEACSATMVK